MLVDMSWLLMVDGWDDRYSHDYIKSQNPPQYCPFVQQSTSEQGTVLFLEARIRNAMK